VNESSSRPRSIDRAVTELARLPGIGPKTAQRLTYHLLRSSGDQVLVLAEALRNLKEGVVTCSVCFNMSDRNPCHICESPDRDHAVICVVENLLDLVAIERTARFRGVYHVLHGAISPMDGIGPDELRIRELVQRAKDTSATEVILATNPNLEGDATATYIARLFEGSDIAVTRLARGLPVGGDLEYADEVTLGNALAGRSSA